MKKVIILTTSTGQGHNQAAASLKTEFIKVSEQNEKGINTYNLNRARS